MSANGKFGFLDDKGKAITPLKYDNASAFYSGMASVNLNGKWGFIDRSGYEKVPFKYDVVIDFSEGLVSNG